MHVAGPRRPFTRVKAADTGTPSFFWDQQLLCRFHCRLEGSDVVLELEVALDVSSINAHERDEAAVPGDRSGRRRHERGELTLLHGGRTAGLGKFSRVRLDLRPLVLGSDCAELLLRRGAECPGGAAGCLRRRWQPSRDRAGRHGPPWISKYEL